jgi:hypothetical protein
MQIFLDKLKKPRYTNPRVSQGIPVPGKSKSSDKALNSRPAVLV